MILFRFNHLSDTSTVFLAMNKMHIFLLEKKEETEEMLSQI